MMLTLTLSFYNIILTEIFIFTFIHVPIYYQLFCMYNIPKVAIRKMRHHFNENTRNLKKQKIREERKNYKK